MVLDSCLHRSSCRNTLPVKFIDNKLTDTPKTSIKSSDSQTPISWSFFCSLIPGSALVLTLGPALTIAKYTNKDLQKTTKFTLKFFH